MLRNATSKGVSYTVSVLIIRFYSGRVMLQNATSKGVSYTVTVLGHVHTCMTVVAYVTFYWKLILYLIFCVSFTVFFIFTSQVFDLLTLIYPLADLVSVHMMYP